MSKKNNDLLGLGLAVAGGFLLGKSFSSEEKEEIKHLKKERKRLMDERDDVIHELEIATQKDYVSPQDRLYDEEEEYEEEDTEDDEEVQQRSAFERLARQNPSQRCILEELEELGFDSLYEVLYDDPQDVTLAELKQYLYDLRSENTEEEMPTEVYERALYLIDKWFED